MTHALDELDDLEPLNPIAANLAGLRPIEQTSRLRQDHQP